MIKLSWKKGFFFLLKRVCEDVRKLCPLTCGEAKLLGNFKVDVCVNLLASLGTLQGFRSPSCSSVTFMLQVLTEDILFIFIFLSFVFIRNLLLCILLSQEFLSPVLVTTMMFLVFLLKLPGKRLKSHSMR